MKVTRAVVLFLVVFALAACKKTDGAPAPKSDRIVSLSPSTTEALFVIGAGDRVVGRSRYCNWPAKVERLPQVGGYVDPSYEAILALRPDLCLENGQRDLTTIAGQLGVTTLLTGSVRRDGRKLKVNARLIQGSTGQQLWSGSFDRELTDIFAVQAELAAAVIDAIVPAARGDTSLPQVSFG